MCFFMFTSSVLTGASSSWHKHYKTALLQLLPLFIWITAAVWLAQELTNRIMQDFSDSPTDFSLYHTLKATV